MAKSKYTAIGGQALIEGILMKSPEKTVIAVRKSDGGIETVPMEGTDLRKKYPVLGLPVIRGVVGFVESLLSGYKAIAVSAEKSGFADLEEETDKGAKTPAEETPGASAEPPAETPTEPASAAEIAFSSAETAQEMPVEATPDEPAPEIPTPETPQPAPQKPKEEKGNSLLFGVIMAVGGVLGVVLAVALFMLIPRLIVSGLQHIFHSEFTSLVRASIEQLIKLCVFVLYVWLVTFMKDIRRVFMYHGAEHKTIFCYEKGLPLTVENARMQRRFHPRCGTSFMILMILISIVFSTLVQIIFPGVYGIPWLWVVVKILMIPLICGVGFEVLRACGKYDNLLTRVISAPGLWLQRLTTKEPDDGMLEVAIAALRGCEPATPDVDRSIDREEPHDNI